MSIIHPQAGTSTSGKKRGRPKAVYRCSWILLIDWTLSIVHPQAGTSASGKKRGRPKGSGKKRSQAGGPDADAVANGGNAGDSNLATALANCGALSETFF